MTAEDLIIGHFNNTLSASQQESLQGLLQSSQDARSLYEQHKSLQAAMESDSDTIVPAMWLEETVLQTALGVASATGSVAVTAGFWSAAKIVALVATVVVSGSTATYFVSSSESPAPAAVKQTSARPEARATSTAVAPDAKPQPAAPATAPPLPAPVQRDPVAVVTRVQPRTPSAKPVEPGIKLGGTDVVIQRNPKTSDPSGNNK